MGMWVAITVGLFVLGSIMALKPNGIEQRLDKLRMTARKLELNPKLVACPEWIRGRDNELGKGMMGQYSLILDGCRFAEACYIVVDGELRPYLNSNDKSKSANFVLDHEPLMLPDTIAPYVKAMYTKANSMAVFWDDICYVKPQTNPTFNSKKIEPDLLDLKARMMDWVCKISA